MADLNRIKLADVMTPSPQTISINATLSEARSQMEKLQVHHLPVMDGTLVESVISDRDVKRFTLPAHPISPDEELLVRDIAPTRAFAADINDPLEKIVTLMAERHMGAVIALDQGELAGIFTETDACRVLAKLLSGHA